MIVGQIGIPALGRLARGEALLTIDGAEGETDLDEAAARQLLSELILSEGEQTEESNVIAVDFHARRRITTEEAPAEQAPTEKEDPQTVAPVQGSMKTNTHEGLKMNTNVSPVVPAVAPETQEAQDFNPTVYHYHQRTDIAFSQLTGARIKALCGDKGAVGATQSGGQPGKAVICPLCGTLYASMSKGKGRE